MPKYLCLQRSLSPPDGADPSEGSEGVGDGFSSAEMQSMYQRFNEWRERYGDNIVDTGGKLGDGTLITEASDPGASFTAVGELAGGYMILTAEDKNEAEEVARACPGLVNERSGVEVIEIHAG